VKNREAAWLEAAKHGDDDAFSNLVVLYQKPVFNLCYRMLGNADDADDAAQETFFKAYKSLGRYDQRRSFATWLLSIASHHCIDLLRKKRLQSISIDDDAYSWMEPRDPEILPEALMIRKEKQAQVQELLACLSPQDRAAVILHYWYGYSYKEIGETLSLTVSAVKSRLHRARGELAGVWKQTRFDKVSLERRRNESPAF